MNGSLDNATPAPLGCQERYAITFGEVAILHIGGEEVGHGRRESGFSVEELRDIASGLGERARLVSVSSTLPSHLQTTENEAAVLVIRNGASLIGGESTTADALLEEQRSVPYDRKYFDTRRQKTLNKQARYNIVFSEEGVSHSDDYRQCTIHSFGTLPQLSSFREGLRNHLGDTHAQGLQAEGNHYYKKASGIGFHGDSERKVVICLSLGQPTVLRYQWRLPGSSEHPFPPVDVEIGHGDVYVMSEKATGYDWRSRSKVRVVHAAGASKYTDK